MTQPSTCDSLGITSVSFLDLRTSTTLLPRIGCFVLATVVELSTHHPHFSLDWNLDTDDFVKTTYIPHSSRGVNVPINKYPHHFD